MNFKNLNLDRGRLQSLLTDAVPGGTVTQLVANGTAHECFVQKDGRACKVQFYFLKDGTTTINYKVGKDHTFSEQIATYIKEHGVTDTRTNFSLSFKEIKADNIALLMDYLQEEAKASIVTNTIADKPQHVIYRATGPGGDTLVFKHFSNGTLQIQGKPLNLYAVTTSFISDWLSLDDVVKSQSQVYRVEIQPEQVRYEIQALLPTSHQFLGETIIKILSPALTLKRIAVELEDYSALTFPSLRALEGYLKKLFSWKNIEIDRDGFKDKFEKNSTGSSYLLTPKLREAIGCPNTCEAIQQGYNLFNKHRHTLFHVNTITDSSRVIVNRQEAIGIVEQVFHVIESTYSKI